MSNIDTNKVTFGNNSAADFIESSSNLIAGLGGNDDLTGTAQGSQVIAGGDIIILRVRAAKLFDTNPNIELRANIGTTNVLLATINLPGLDPRTDPLALNIDRWDDIPVSIDYDAKSLNSITLSQTNYSDFTDPVTGVFFTQGFWLQSIKRSDGATLKVDSITRSDGKIVDANPDPTKEVVGYVTVTATQTPSVAGPAVNTAGDDTLTGGPGDTLLGGEGNDTYFVDTYGNLVNIVEYDTPGSGVDMVKVTGEANSVYTLPENVENLVFSTAFNGNASSKFIGNASANEIKADAPAVVNFGVTLDGLQGDDTLVGGKIGDTIYGGQGRDSIQGKGGDDVIYGASGLDANADVDLIFDDGASDTLVGGTGNDQLHGGDGDDFLLDREISKTTFVINANVLAKATDHTLLAAEKYVLFDVYVNGKKVETSGQVAAGEKNVSTNSSVTVSVNLRPEEIRDVKLMLTDRSADWKNLKPLLGTNQAGEQIQPTTFDITINSLTVAGQTQTAPTETVYGYWNKLINNDPAASVGLAFRSDAHIATQVSASYQFQVGGAVLAGTFVNQDTMDGGLGDDTYYVDSAGDQVIETDTVGSMPEYGGQDTVLSTISYTAAPGIEEVRLLNMISTAAGDSDALGGKTATGNALDNVIIGNARDNIIDGAGGNDFLDGGAGNDTLIGSIGSNTYVVDSLGDVIKDVHTDSDGVLQGNTDTDAVISSITYRLTSVELSTIENLTLSGFAVEGEGNALANQLTGNLASNLLKGGAGNDTLFGAGGDDTLDGGLDDDTYIVDQFDFLSKVTIVEALDAGNDTVVFVRGSVPEVINSVQTFKYTLANGLENIELGIFNTDGSTEQSLARNDITGNKAANKMTGSVNEDALTGLDGNDTLLGELGNDTLFGGANADMLDGGFGDDSLGGGDGADTLVGGDGDDLLVGDGGDDSLDGGDGADTLVGGNGADILVGGDGDDTYRLFSTANTVSEDPLSSGDNDTAEFNYATAVIDLSSTAFAGIENATVQFLDFSTLIKGNDAANILTGNSGNDSLVGGLGDDTLNGGGGNDVLTGGLDEADLLAGGIGNDTYRLFSVANLVSERTDSSDGIDTALFYYAAEVIDLSSPAFAGFENAKVQLLGASTKMTGNDKANALTGSSGNDALVGGLGDDTLNGGLNVDTLDGGGGNDLLIGGADEADSLTGGIGDDTYQLYSATNIVKEETSPAGGIDTAEFYYATAAIDLSSTALAGFENATVFTGTSTLLKGNAKANKLTGGSGNDTLVGDSSTPADTLSGLKGDDVYQLYNSSTTVQEDTLTGGGTDALEIYYGATSIDLTPAAWSQIENVSVKDNSKATNVTGNGLANKLEGNTLANKLAGGNGNDTLIGGTSSTVNDTLVGGAGDDVYRIYTATTVVDNVTGALAADIDTLEFWYGATAIDLSNVSYAKLNNATLMFATAGTTLSGNALANKLTGGKGNDTLIGGTSSTANDTLVGGAGNDVYRVYTAATVVQEDSGTGALAADIDTLEFWYSATAIDLNTASYAMLNNAALMATTSGTTLRGNALANKLTGGAGNDTLIGGDTTANDTLEGGLGNDVYQLYTAATAVVDTGGTADLLEIFYSTTGTVDMKGTLAWNAIERATLRNTSATNITGNDLANALTGNGAANILNGGIGNDSLYGLAGNDQLIGGTGNDLLDGGAGDDVLSSAGGNDTAFWGAATGVDTWSDSGGTDTLRVTGLTHDKLWFTREGADVLIKSLDKPTNSPDVDRSSIRIKNFYSSATASTAGAGYLDNIVLVSSTDVFNDQLSGTGINALVSAMAGLVAPTTGAITNTSTLPKVVTAIINNWV
jgi:Ca2+-binding RTX toxin-like protein